MWVSGTFTHGFLVVLHLGLWWGCVGVKSSLVMLCVILQGVMVRLMLVLAPVMCILSGIAVSSTLTTYMKNLDVARKDKKVKKAEANYPIKNEVSCKYLLILAGIDSCLLGLFIGYHL